jgi:predicted metal-binding protein
MIQSPANQAHTLPVIESQMFIGHQLSVEGASVWRGVLCYSIGMKVTAPPWIIR